MSERIKNSIGLRTEMEKRGLGLNASGSYVLASLDLLELEHLKSVNFQAVKWQEELSVLIVRGPKRNGCLVRFVKLSVDGRYCQFPGRFRSLSPRLLETEPVSMSDFIESIVGNPAIRIIKLNDQEEQTGLLAGDRDAKYKSLITVRGGLLTAVDIEEKAPAHALHEKTRIVDEKPPDGESMRRAVLNYKR